MQIQDMTKGRFTAEGLSTGKSESNFKPAEPHPPHTPPYQVPSEANPGRVEEQSCYLPYGRKHAAKFQVEITWTLEQALQLRDGGKLVLSIREADIAARSNISLEKKFIHHALKAIGGFFTEGLAGEKDNAFALRELYNRGIKFKREHFGSVTADRKLIAEAAMKECLEKLVALQLPAWPEEVENGFAVDLTKPEYMDWHQYTEAKKRPIVKSSANTGEIVHDLDTFYAERSPASEPAAGTANP